MKTNQESSDIMKDFSTMRIEVDKLEELTVEKAKKAYHKVAAEVHPDKADPANLKQVAEFTEFTAAFQDLGNSYQRVLKYIVENLKNQSEDANEPLNEEEIFSKDNLDKFNFPFKNMVASLYKWKTGLRMSGSSASRACMELPVLISMTKELCVIECGKLCSVRVARMSH